MENKRNAFSLGLPSLLFEAVAGDLQNRMHQQSSSRRSDLPPNLKSDEGFRNLASPAGASLEGAQASWHCAPAPKRGT